MHPRTRSIIARTSRRLLFAAAAMTASACTSTPLMEVSRADCLELRDHVVDMAITRAAGPGEPSPARAARLEAHRQNLRAAQGERFISDCQLRRSPEFVDCALDADDKTSLDDCKDL